MLADAPRRYPFLDRAGLTSIVIVSAERGADTRRWDGREIVR